jgi:hypothetical protein
MKNYQSRQSLLKSNTDLIHNYFDFIHSPPSTINKLLKKIHETRTLTLKKYIKKYHLRTKKIVKM